MEEEYIYPHDTDSLFNLFTVLWFGIIWAQACVLVALALTENKGFTRRRVARLMFYLNFLIGVAMTLWLLDR